MFNYLFEDVNKGVRPIKKYSTGLGGLFIYFSSQLTQSNKVSNEVFVKAKVNSVDLKTHQSND